MTRTGDVVFSLVCAAPVVVAFVVPLAYDRWAERRDRRNTAAVIAEARAFHFRHAEYLASVGADCARCGLGTFDCECNGPWAVWPIPEAKP